MSKKLAPYHRYTIHGIGFTLKSVPPQYACPRLSVSNSSADPPSPVKSPTAKGGRPPASVIGAVGSAIADSHARIADPLSQIG